MYGFPDAPEPYARTEAQRARVRKSYERKRAWMDERGLCVWNGEWGPVYARREYEGEETEEINERRYNVLHDQLELYAKASRLPLQYCDPRGERHDEYSPGRQPRAHRTA